MKAIVNVTGDIVNVIRNSVFDKDVFYDSNGQKYNREELFFDFRKKSFPKDDDYWTRLEHQYAGMAMQGLLANHYITDRIDISVLITEAASTFAKSLVEKVRYEENPKELEGLKKELEALKIEKTILENKVKLLKEERK